MQPRGTVIVCEPFPEAVEAGNEDLGKYLYREKVDTTRVVQQHQEMVRCLKQGGHRVMDLRCWMSPEEREGLSLDVRTNLVFVRDPLLVTPMGMVLGKMKEDVRAPEVDLWATLLPRMGHSVLYRVAGKDAVVEGGDYVCQEACTWIGIGARTNLEGAMELMSANVLGTPRVVLIGAKNEDLDMHRIHLDCYLGIVGPKKCVVWEEAVREGGAYERVVYEYVRTGMSYQLNPERMGLSLGAYLQQEGWDVQLVDTQRQNEYACNVLSIPGGCVYVPEAEAAHIPGAKKVAPLEELYKMYGGIHCATQWLPAGM